MKKKTIRIETMIDEETNSKIIESGKSKYQFLREAIHEKIEKNPNEKIEKILVNFEKKNEDNFIQLFEAIMQEVNKVEIMFNEIKELNSKSLNAIKNSLELIHKG